MRRIIFFIVSVVLYCGIARSQTTIWSEDFSSYVEHTGINNSGNLGDYPDNVTKWSLDASNTNFTESEDYIKVVSVYSNKILEARDTEGDAVWETELIDLSGYVNSSFSLEAFETGSMESSDYYDVYYKTNGGDYTLISNWLSLGSDTHTLIDDWSSTTIEILLGTVSSVQIKVIMKNNSGVEKMRIDDVMVTGYSPATAQWKTTAENTNWNDADNWSNSSVPTGGTDITIPTSADNYPVITNAIESPAECNNLTIQSGGSLTINVDKALTIFGDLDIANSKTDGSLSILSDATGTGSLILIGTASGPATVQQYIPGYGEATNHWHLISTAIDCSGIPSTMLPDGSDFDLYHWKEASNLWYNYNGGSFEDTQICTGKGYLISYQQNTTIEFSGSLNAGTITSGSGEMPAITYNTDQGNGWNLMGNPYSCAIDWDLISKSENINGAVYVRDGNNGQYISWNGTTGSLTDGVIPAMNGFWVKADATDQQISVSPADQLHGGTSFYKSNTILENHLCLSISGSGYSDKTYLMLSNSTTNNFDNWADAYKLYGIEEAPQIYSELDDIKYSINVLPIDQGKINIPIHLKVGIDSEYEIQFEGIDSFENVTDITLIDHITGANHDLMKINSIKIHSSPDHSYHRFTLTISRNSNDEQEINDNDHLHIFNNNHTLLIKTNTYLTGDLILYDLNGHIVFTDRLVNQVNYKTELHLSGGIYFVRFISDKIHTKKLIIN